MPNAVIPETEPLLETATAVAQCPVCGAREFRWLGRPGHAIGEPVFGPHLHEYGVARCACGLVLTNPRPSTELLDRFYGSRIYDCHQANQSAASGRRARSVLKTMAGQGPYAGKRLLDFGCGGGYFLPHATEAGWTAMGFDVGAAAIETCRANGLTVTNRFADLEPASFDVIFMNHVLEHIEEPVGLLRSLRALLASQGKLFIEVPNVRSLRARMSLSVLSRRYGFDERYRAHPIHLWYFSPDTLSKLLRSAGFTPTLVTTTGMGLEELRLQPEVAAAAVTREGNQRRQSRLQPVKDAMKRAFFGAHLGENVLAAAV